MPHAYDTYALRTRTLDNERPRVNHGLECRPTFRGYSPPVVVDDVLTGADRVELARRLERMGKS